MKNIKHLVEKFSIYIVSNPYKFVCASLMLVALTCPFIFTLKADYGVRIWFLESDPLIHELNALEQKFGNDERIVIAVHSPSGIFKKSNIKVIQDLTEKVWLIPDVIRVDSLSNYNYTQVYGDDLETAPFLDPEEDISEMDLIVKKKQALNDSVILNQFLSRDANTTVIFGALKPGIKKSPNYQLIVQSIKKMMKDFKGSGDLTYHFVGAATVNDAYREVSENDLKVMIPINLIVMFVFLLFIFKTVEGVVIPLALVCITITMTMGVSALFNFPFNNLSSAIPGILIAICMADTIHVLTTYYSSLKAGETGRNSAIETLKKNLIPTFLTSVTTMIGFFSLTQTELLPVKHLGWLAGIGTFFAWLLTIFFICPLLPKVPYRPVKKLEFKKIDESTSIRYIEWVDKYKKMLVLLMFCSASIFLYFGTKNIVNSDPLKHFSKKLKISKDNNFLLKTFNGLGGPQLVVDCGEKNCIKNPIFLKKVENFISWLESQEYVNQVTSITKVIKNLNQKLNSDKPEFYKIPETRQSVAELLLMYSMGLPQGMDLNNQMSLDNRFLRLGIMWSVHDASRSLKYVEVLKAEAKKQNLEISVTGKLFLYHRMVYYIVETFFRSISTALVLISILLILTLQSWRLGFLSLLPNVVPLMFGAGLMTLLSIHVDIGTSLIISVCLGIAVDDTIHFLSHFKDHLREVSDTKKALIYVFKTTAPALIFTTVILTISFGVFSFADFVPNVNFGILCSVILTMALVTDLVFLPAILLLFRVKK